MNEEQNLNQRLWCCCSLMKIFHWCSRTAAQWLAVCSAFDCRLQRSGGGLWWTGSQWNRICSGQLFPEPKGQKLRRHFPFISSGGAELSSTRGADVGGLWNSLYTSCSSHLFRQTGARSSWLIIGWRWIKETIHSATKNNDRRKVLSKWVKYIDNCKWLILQLNVCIKFNALRAFVWIHDDTFCSVISIVTTTIQTNIIFVKIVVNKQVHMANTPTVLIS